MSAVGLTKAMRRALEARMNGLWFAVKFATQRRAEAAGFIEARMLGNGGVSPHGHAALAAPRMTVSQFRILAYLESGSWPDDRSVSSSSAWRSCADKGWIEYESDFDWGLTPSGLKALNNVRAATSSELYKDNMP